MAKTHQDNAKIKAFLTHNYCGVETMETNAKGTKNILTSPSKPTVPQNKSKGDKATANGTHSGDTSDATILAAISTLQNMMEDFQLELKQNTLTMTNTAKAVEFNSAEIKE